MEEDVPTNDGNEEDVYDTFKEKTREIVMYVCFIVIFSIGLMFARDPTYSYFYNAMMGDLFVFEEFPSESSHVMKTFNDVATIEEFWQYLEGPFLGGFHDGDGKIYGVNQVIGSARLRQLRVKPSACDSSKMEGAFGRCLPPFKAKHEEKSTYGVNGTFSFSPKLGTVFGKVTNYRGGGYTEFFGENEEENIARMAFLREHDWVGVETRAVVVEFVTANANINSFFYGKLLFEFLPSGGIVPSHAFYTLRLDNYTGSLSGRVQLAMDILVWLGVLFYTVEELLEFYKLRMAYLSDGWNSLDLINLALFYVQFAMQIHIYRLVDALHIDYTERSDYVDLAEVTYYTQIMFNVKAVNAFFLWSKTFKFTMFFSQATVVIGRTIKRGVTELAVFCCLIMFLIIGFAQAGVLAFGLEIFEYRNFFVSMMSLVRSLMGDFDFDSMYQVSRIMGPLFFLAFTVLFVFILLNIFLAIVNDSYAREAEEAEKREPFSVLQICNEIEEKHPSPAMLYLIRRVKQLDRVQQALENQTLDTDQDGVVTKQEYEAQFSTTSERRLFDQMDGDGDGRLDAEEQMELAREVKRQKTMLDIELKNMSAAEATQTTTTTTVAVPAPQYGLRTPRRQVKMIDVNPALYMEDSVREELAALRNTVNAMERTLRSLNERLGGEPMPIAAVIAVGSDSDSLIDDL